MEGLEGVKRYGPSAPPMDRVSSINVPTFVAHSPADLLAHVKLIYPETVRFLVTANRDLDVAARAVNEGSVHRYFLKPWDEAKLRTALEIVLASKHGAGR